MTTIKGRILATRDTTAHWNAKLSFVPLRGEIIVYTDHGKDENDVDVPGIKIGDGNAYLIDLPFVGDDVAYQILSDLGDHISDTTVHVTSSEKSFWNDKLNCEIDGTILVLNRN